MTEPRDTLLAVFDDPARLAEVPPPEARVLVAKLAPLLFGLFASAHASDGGASVTDRSLTVKEAADRLGVSPSYLYKHADDYSFSRREGRRLVFSERGLDRYLTRAA
jgi:excisionase family DNA binding protein